MPTNPDFVLYRLTPVVETVADEAVTEEWVNGTDRLGRTAAARALYAREVAICAASGMFSRLWAADVIDPAALQVWLDRGEGLA